MVLLRADAQRGKSVAALGRLRCKGFHADTHAVYGRAAVLQNRVPLLIGFGRYAQLLASLVDVVTV